MSEIKVHGGDFSKGVGSFSFDMFALKTPEHPILGERIHKSEIESIDVASQDSSKGLGGTVAGGVAGGLVAGPLGMIAGAMVSGNKSEITFIVKFKDGRGLVASCKSKDFPQIQAAAFEGSKMARITTVDKPIKPESKSEDKPARKLMFPASKPPKEGGLYDFLSAGNVLMLLIVLEAISYRSASGIVAAIVGCLVMTPKINRKIAQQFDRPYFSLVARFGMGLVLFFIAAGLASPH